MGFGGNEMIKTSLKKSLICGIIVLFLGMSIMPIAGSLSVEKHSSMIGSIKELNTVTKTGSRGFNITLIGTMGENGWYVSDVLITFTADNGSVPKVILYKLDNGSWMTYEGPFKVTTDGHHSVEALIQDQYGNEWHLGPVFFKIDKTSPMVVLNKETFKNKIIFTACPADNMSGIDRVEFYFNGLLQTNITAPGPYVWTLQPIPHYGHGDVIVYDYAGNYGMTYFDSLSQSNKQLNTQQYIQYDFLRSLVRQQMNQLLLNLIMHHQIIGK